MIIRQLTAEDAAVFQALRLRGLEEDPVAFAASFEAEKDLDLSEVRGRLEPGPKGVVFGAFVDQNLSGVVGLKRESHAKLAHKAWIWGMYVASEKRGQGIGKRLLTAALEHARSRSGLRSVTLGVGATNAAAHRLYLSVGFVEFGREPDFLQVDGKFYDEIHMVHLLGDEERA